MMKSDEAPISAASRGSSGTQSTQAEAIPAAKKTESAEASVTVIDDTCADIRRVTRSRSVTQPTAASA